MHYLDPLSYTVAVALIAINLLFYIAFVLFLGTLFRNRSQVLLVALGWLFASPLLAVDMIPWLSQIVPYGLPDMAIVLAMQSPLGKLPLRPVLLTLIWAMTFVALAVRHFSGEEL